eukprot:Hpha_TRINITY_DN16570_c1_g1::TRINITY_DN16570_c1_g1_i1::g.132292::m.132292
MSEVMPMVAATGGMPPRGVFRRRAHLWQQAEQQLPPHKRSAPLPPGGRGASGLIRPPRVVAPPAQSMEVLPREEETLKVTRLRGLPLEKKVEVQKPAPVKMYVGLWQGLYPTEDDEETTAPRSLKSCFESRFKSGILPGYLNFMKQREQRLRGLPPPAFWISGPPALLTPLADMFVKVFPTGLRAEAAAKAKAQERAEQRWNNPLGTAYPAAAGWVVGGNKAGKSAAELFAGRFPNGLRAREEFKMAAKQKAEERWNFPLGRKAAMPSAGWVIGANANLQELFEKRFPNGVTLPLEKQERQRFWAQVTDTSSPRGLLSVYHRTSAMMQEGTLSSYFDKLLQELGPAPTCPHSGMQCACNAFDAVAAKPPQEGNRGPEVLCVGDALHIPVAACFTERFPAGLRSQQERSRRVAAVLRIQGMLKVWRAKEELSRLRDMEAFFKQETA